MTQKPADDDDELGLAIYIMEREYVVMHFTMPMQLIQLPKDAAIQMAAAILEAAEMLPDEGDEK